MNAKAKAKIAAYMNSDRSGSLCLRDCTGLTALPDRLTVGSYLDLSGCTGLTALPYGLTVGGSLDLSGCTGLTALPDRLTVGSYLDLRDCTGLTALPYGLTVGGSLCLRDCTGLTALPDGLTVGSYLDLSGCTGLTALPDGFRINGQEVPVVPDLDKKIAEAIDNGGHLNMDAWHTCDTTHCRAGWAIHLAGQEGAALEKSINSQGAGALIYLASRPGMPFPDFHCSDEAALSDIRKCAGLLTAES